MKSKVKKVVNILYKALKENFSSFKGAYLYGSFAKNTSHKFSDIDIVVLFDKIPDRKALGLLWRIAGRIEAEYDVFLDLNPTTKEELKINPFYYEEVVNKGIFYDAA